MLLHARICEIIKYIGKQAYFLLCLLLLYCKEPPIHDSHVTSTLLLVNLSLTAKTLLLEKYNPLLHIQNDRNKKDMHDICKVRVSVMEKNLSAISVAKYEIQSKRHFPMDDSAHRL